MSLLERLHDLIMVWLVVVTIVVVLIGLIVLSNLIPFSLKLESMLLEITWTIIPMVILLRIAFPSIGLLCHQDAFYVSPFYTFKLISNQWNWQRHEESFQVEHLLDSTKLDELRRFETPLIMTSIKENRIMLTRRDVLHSLGIPGIGVKVDSAPGRINSTVVVPLFLGLLTGSCYELCGRGHRAIPIFFFIS